MEFTLRAVVAAAVLSRVDAERRWLGNDGGYGGPDPEHAASTRPAVLRNRQAAWSVDGVRVDVALAADGPGWLATVRKGPRVAVAVTPHGSGYRVTVDGHPHAVQVDRDDALAGLSGRPCELTVDGAVVVAWREADSPPARSVTGNQALVGNEVQSLLPGTIARVSVEAGATVERGQVVMVLEAMKMENEVRAPHAGRVAAVHVAPGQSVRRGSPLFAFEAGA